MQNLALTPAQRHILREILARRQNAAIPGDIATDNWLDWLQLPGENQQLEAALAWLSGRQHTQGARRMSAALDKLAKQYLAGGGMADPEELGVFLFGDDGLSGVLSDERYEPLHSDILSVIEGGRGLPISLCCIFILVGWRLDIAICGCAFPGHFLARAPLSHGESSDDDLIFDPYRGGGIMRPDEVAALRKAAPLEMTAAATAREIIARVLRNMANAHFQNHDTGATRDVLALLAELENAAPHD